MSSCGIVPKRDGPARAIPRWNKKNSINFYKSIDNYRKRLYFYSCEAWNDDDLERPKIFSFDYRNSVLAYGLESNCSNIIQNMALLLHGKEEGYIMYRHAKEIISCIEEMNENLKYLKEALEEYKKQGV